MRELQPLDITNSPDLLRLAEEVQASKRPRVLQRGHEAIAVLMPVARAARRGIRDTRSTMAALQASAGSWKGVVDTRELKSEIVAARGSDRLSHPPTIAASPRSTPVVPPACP
jgi:hypothetical protein